MALTYRVFYSNCQYIRNITKPVRWSFHNFHPIRVLSSGIFYRNNDLSYPVVQAKYLSPVCIREYSSECKRPAEEPEKKKGLVQRLKQMYIDYWYVVLPVHLVTSAMWFGSFYYTVQSGMDVVAFLEYVGVSESLLAKIRDSSAGYVALTLGLYKIVSPLRYAVTIGVTTVAIRRLTALGWIKPVPSRERMKEMWSEKKDNLQDRFKESKEKYKSQMQVRRSNVMEEMKRYREEMKSMKNKMKKMNGSGSDQSQ